METINILHLSDLHFGSEKDKGITASSQRENTLNDLIKFIIEEVPTKLQPNIVVISGDIRWSGKKEDYLKAQKWIKTLLGALNIDAKNLVLCCGNHDIDLDKAKRTVIPTKVEEADEYLSLENLSYFDSHFEQYELFCNELGTQPLVIDDHKNYLIGKIDINNIRFIVLNTAWYYRENNTENLWIGLPQLELMKNKNQLRIDDKWTIAILHHPPECLDYSEIHATPSRVCSYQYLAENVDIILSGHTHDYTISKVDIKHNEAPLIIGGSTYSGNSYRNNFSILQINKGSMNITRYTFEYEPSKGRWLFDQKDVIDVPHKKNTELIIKNAKKLEIEMIEENIKKEILSLLETNESLNIIEIISVLWDKKINNTDRIFTVLENLTKKNIINNPFEYDSYTGKKYIPGDTKIYIHTHN